MKYYINKVQLLVIIGLLSFVFGSQTNSQGYLTNMRVYDGQDFDNSVTVIVRTDSGDPAVSAHVILQIEEGDPARQYEKYTDEMGIVHFPVVLEGYYTLEVNLLYYNPVVQLNIPVYNDTTINIGLTEIFLPPQEFHVNSMIGKATWLPPPLYYNNETDKGSVLEGYNLYMEEKRFHD